MLLAAFFVAAISFPIAMTVGRRTGWKASAVHGRDFCLSFEGSDEDVG